MSIILERMPPGTREQRHRHARARQFFYVLNGELTIEPNAEDAELAAEVHDGFNLS